MSAQRVVLTGSSGRVGRAIFAALAGTHEVIGVDRSPFATTRLIADFTDADRLAAALDGADAVIHAAAYHAPHVGSVDEAEFARVNVEGTRQLAEKARAAGCRTFVFTSTTALYGDAVIPGACTWIDESVSPRPVSIYHRTKVAAEAMLEGIAAPGFAVRVIRMSRCFPEPAPVMAMHRLNRGVDVRDVADAHVAALSLDGAAFQRFVISGATPFRLDDVDALAADAPSVLRVRAPSLVAAFAARGWPLPRTIDRVYAPLLAESVLHWQARHGFDEVLAQLDRRSLEVLPPQSRLDERSE
jgi:nucleoside-diphosphate-sugar epimerase